MIINLDKYLFQTEPFDLCGRFFTHDIFISHRQSDSPKKIIKHLNKIGVNIVWDNMMNTNDRRVTHAVHQALTNSRYIGLYISNNFSDSPWCKAEYLNGLRIENEYGIDRVVVLLETASAEESIPENLKSNTFYTMSDSGIQSLAKWLLDNNNENEPSKRLRELPNHYKGLNSDLLTLEERLNLLNQRLSYYVKGNRLIFNESNPSKQAKQLSLIIGNEITEFEIILRDFFRLISPRLQSEQKDLNLTRSELSYILKIARLFERSYSNPNILEEMRQAEKWFLDFLFKPLLCIVRSPKVGRSAAKIYRNICENLKEGECSKEVPIYLETLIRIERGDDYEKAFFTQKLALVRNL
jgi:hypothetical protein